MIFFDTVANIIYDINFVIQIVLIVLLIVGVSQKHNRRRHGTILATATIINLLTFAIIMFPSFILKYSLIELHGLIIVTWIHAIVGAIAISSGLIFSIRFLIFLRQNKPLNCGTKMEMRMVNLTWIVSLIFGLIFYFVFYTTPIA